MDEGKASHRFKEINRIFSQDIKLYILYRILGNHKDHIACLHSLPWKNSFSGNFTYKYNETVPPTNFSKISNYSNCLGVLHVLERHLLSFEVWVELVNKGSKWRLQHPVYNITNHVHCSLRWAGGLTNLSIKSLSKGSSQPLRFEQNCRKLGKIKGQLFVK